MIKDTVYVDYAGGHFEAWQYRRGGRIFLSYHTYAEIVSYAEKWDCELVLTDEAKLFVQEEK